MAHLAQAAEQAGWDAVFLEDYIVYPGPDPIPTYDPWVVMAAMAQTTSRIRLGTLVTPASRRRPWKLAMEATTLDHLSQGRVILGLGAGDAKEPSFAAAGEPAKQWVLGERLEEAVEIIAQLWEGKAVGYRGKHFQLDGLRLSPVPLQQPRIPIWIGGDWLVGAVRRRLVRWDGCCVYSGTPGTADHRPLLADQVLEISTLVESQRGPGSGFDICVGGRERDLDSNREREYLRELAQSGATWWQEWVRPGDAERVSEAVLRGPPLC